MTIMLGRRFALAAPVICAVAAAAPAAARADFAISTVAGTGIAGFAGDNGSAAGAQLSVPIAVAAEPGGGFLVADAGNHRVRRVLLDGRIVTVAGNGVAGNAGDGGPATAAQLTTPRGLGILDDGSFLVADRDAHVVRRVAPDGTISTVAGTGVAGFSGDNGPATSAQLNLPYAATPLPGGQGFLIADRGNHAIRKVDAAGRITTVAGTPPVGGFSGDGGAATSAALNAPCAVAVDPRDPTGSTFYIPDRDNNRVRRVAAGTISTVAGNGTTGDAGDGGPATSASTTGAYAVLAARDGTLLIGERGGNRIRSVSPAGVITTIAGTGAGGFNGDGRPASAFQLNDPVGLSVLPNGSILVADNGNQRVRMLSTAPSPIAQAGAPAVAPAPLAAAAPAASAPAASAPAAFRFALTTAVASRRSLRLRFTLTAATRVRVDVRRGTRRVLRRTLKGRAGVNAITLRVRLRRGRYAVRLMANGNTVRRTVRVR